MSVKPIDVVITGLNIILPLMTEDVLKYSVIDILKYSVIPIAIYTYCETSLPSNSYIITFDPRPSLTVGSKVMV